MNKALLSFALTASSICAMAQSSPDAVNILNKSNQVMGVFTRQITGCPAGTYLSTLEKPVVAVYPDSTIEKAKVHIVSQGGGSADLEGKIRTNHPGSVTYLPVTKMDAVARALDIGCYRINPNVPAALTFNEITAARAVGRPLPKKLSF